MKERIRQAAIDGLVWGIRAAIAIVFVALATMWLAGDYQTTRDEAKRGAAAFAYIKQQLEQHDAAAKVPPAGEKPK